MTEAKKLKCKFCPVQVNRWKRTKGGKAIDGFDTMKDHIMVYHPEEAEKMGMQW